MIYVDLPIAIGRIGSFTISVFVIPQELAQFR